MILSRPSVDSEIAGARRRAAASLAGLLMLMLFSGCRFGSQTFERYVAHKPGVSLGKIIQVREFALGPVGDAGITSEICFLQQLSAGKESIRELFERGDAQAQSYALLGLRWLASEEYFAARQRYLARWSQVTTMSGCLVEFRSPADVVAEIESGAYDAYRPTAKSPRTALDSVR